MDVNPTGRLAAIGTIRAMGGDPRERAPGAYVNDTA